MWRIRRPSCSSMYSPGNGYVGQCSGFSLHSSLGRQSARRTRRCKIKGHDLSEGEGWSKPMAEHRARTSPLASSAAPFRAAAIQFEPVFDDKERNVAELLRLTEEAARGGARLIVHPEMATTGYCWANRAEVAPFVEPIPGPTTDCFARLAAAHDCYVVVGLPEV